jgi:hypothetical protein
MNKQKKMVRERITGLLFYDAVLGHKTFSCCSVRPNYQLNNKIEYLTMMRGVKTEKRETFF